MLEGFYRNKRLYVEQQFNRIKFFYNNFIEESFKDQPSILNIEDNKIVALFYYNRL